MPRPLPCDPAAHARARRLAVTGTWLIVLGWCYLVACLVKAATERNPVGALALLVTGIATPVLALLARFLWRRERATRAAWFDGHAGLGERSGVPELDTPARPHLSLNADGQAPRRW